MSIINQLLRQKAVWWAKSTMDVYGKPTYLAPAEIRCRWEPDQREIVDASGLKRMASAAVDHDTPSVTTGDVLYLGNLTDLTTPQKADPESVTGVWKVQRVETTPDVPQRQQWRTAYL